MTDSEKLDLLLVGMEGMQGDIHELKNDVAELRTDVDTLKVTVEGMQGDIAALKNGQKEIRKDVKKLTQKVEDTYQIALEAWGLSMENRAQLTT